MATKIFRFNLDVSKRVAEKILGKSYGRLSIIANYRLKYLNKFDISANCFFPKPKVISSVIHLVPVTKIKYEINDIKNLEYITNLFFNKGKMIKKEFKNFNLQQLKEFRNLNLNDRPSDLKKNFIIRLQKFMKKDN